MKEKIKTIFIGTPDFAVPSLEALIKDEQFDIISVITQPDKKVGRKQILTPPPIKTIAEKYNIPVWQPDSIINLAYRQAGYQLSIKDIDLIVVAAYAQIIPESILNLPRYGCVNVHGSLLPKYRGASCIQEAILNGDGETGVTIMKMDKGLDTGPILAQKGIKIMPDDTAESLYAKLSTLGAEILAPTLKDYTEDKIKPKQQDNSLASYVGLLKKEDGKINWSKSAVEIERFIRAMHSWPGAYGTIINYQLSITKKIKIIEVENKIININNYKPGELFLHEGKLSIQCGKDALVIKKLQLEGKKEMTATEFLNGYKNFIGSILN